MKEEEYRIAQRYTDLECDLWELQKKYVKLEKKYKKYKKLYKKYRKENEEVKNLLESIHDCKKEN